MIQALLRHRIAFSWLVALLVFYLATPGPATLAAGAPVALAGLGIRAAAAGVIQKGTLLARDGPYRLTRNPLYFGSFLLALGFGIMSGEAWAAGTLILASVLVFPPMIRSEEALLRSRFGSEFEDFSAEVPRFLPRRLSLGIFENFSYARYLRNREYNAAIGFVAFTAILVLKCFFGRT